MFFIIAGIVILLMFTLFGFFTWASSDFPLAMREIALNTREERHRGSGYPMLKMLSTLIKIFAVLIWIIGIVLSYYVVFVLASGQLPFPMGT